MNRGPVDNNFEVVCGQQLQAVVELIDEPTSDDFFTLLVLNFSFTTERQTRVRLCGKETAVWKQRAISARIKRRQAGRPPTTWLRVTCWVGNSPLVRALVNLAMRFRRLMGLLVGNGFSQRILITRRLSFSLGMTQGSRALRKRIVLGIKCG